MKPFDKFQRNGLPLKNPAGIHENTKHIILKDGVAHASSLHHLPTTNKEPPYPRKEKASTSQNHSKLFVCMKVKCPKKFTST